MTLSELTNLVAILVGPLAAVCVTLWFQSRSEKRQRKNAIFNTIWDTHHDPSNALYSSAIRSVPIVFDNDRAVKEAWRKFMENTRNAPAPENTLRHNEEFLDRKHDLISAIARSIGRKVNEREVRESVYQAKANVETNEKLQEALAALPRIAKAIESQVSNNA